MELNCANAVKIKEIVATRLLSQNESKHRKIITRCGLQMGRLYFESEIDQFTI